MFVTITDAPAIQNIFDSPGGTMLVWIKPNSDGEANVGRIYGKKSSVNPYEGFYLRVGGEASGYVELRFFQEFSTATGGWVTTNAVVPIGIWSLVAVTYDNSAVGNDPIIYVNGVVQAITESLTPVVTRLSDVGQNMLIGNNTPLSATFDGGIALLEVIKGQVWSAFDVMNSYEREKHLIGEW